MTLPNVICDRSHAHIRVVRFTNPDLRVSLYDAEPITDCELYREIESIAQLSTLASGETVILNFGLIEWFPTIFYRALVALRNEIHARNARLFLCCLTPLVREAFDIMSGGRLFDVRSLESRAIADASK